MLFSSFFPPQLLFLIPRNLPKLFKNRTPGLMRNTEKQTSKAALSLILPTLPASTQEPHLFGILQSPEPRAPCHFQARQLHPLPQPLSSHPKWTHHFLQGQIRAHPTS